MPATPLSTVELHILLALIDEDRHGYAIMSTVAELTGQRVRLGPGTLYGAIKRLIERGLLEESGERPAADLDDERRRYYRITRSGRQAVSAQLRDFERLLDHARRFLPSLGEGRR